MTGGAAGKGAANANAAEAESATGTATAAETGGGGAAGSAAAAAAAAAAAGTRDGAAAAESGGGDTHVAAMRRSRGMTSLTPRASIHQSSPLLLAGVMDPVASPDTQELSGDTFPHEALVLVLQQLPLDARACAACVCPAWRAATAHPLLWQELSFERCAVHINDATLATLCSRAGAALRTLNLSAGSRACFDITSEVMVTSLRGGGCTGLRRLDTLLPHAEFRHHHCLTAQLALLLAAACPLLQHAACTIHCTPPMVAAVLTALPGPLTLWPVCFCSSVGMAQIAECLRTSTSITSFSLSFSDIGDAGAIQLAQSLRANTTLTDLKLSHTGVGNVGAMQLAECLRINATLTNLRLSCNIVGDAGAIQLAECLRINTTLTSLDLGVNEIFDAAVMQLAECLRINTTLTDLILTCNGFGDIGATALAKCLRVNTTLTCLALDFNNIGDAGAKQLADCLRVNATLTNLNLRGSDRIGAAGERALKAACRPQCVIKL